MAYTQSKATESTPASSIRYEDGLLRLRYARRMVSSKTKAEKVTLMIKYSLAALVSDIIFRFDTRRAGRLLRLLQPQDQIVNEVQCNMADDWGPK